jgi:hypothetical protein
VGQPFEARNGLFDLGPFLSQLGENFADIHLNPPSAARRTVAPPIDYIMILAPIPKEFQDMN